MKNYIDYEIDWYLLEEISTKDSGLSYDIFVTMNDGINKFPYVFCRRQNMNFLDAIIVSIEKNPCVIRGVFKTIEEENKVKQFIILNKDLFLEYWNCKYTSDRFFEELKFIKEEI